MADDEERVKAEKLAAAKKRVAQIQKQKKKASNKKSTGADTPKEDKEGESSKGGAAAEAEAEATPAEEEATPTPTPDEKQDAPEQAAGDVKNYEGRDEDGNGDEDETKAETQQQTSSSPPPPQPSPEREGSPTEPMPEAPTSLPSETEPQIRIDKSRASVNHDRQPSLSIQSKMRSSSFRKTSVSQGSVSPSPSTAIRSPTLPPLSADGDSVQEVYRKQSTRIEELERENKRMEKELEEASGRWRKTEEQLEDLRESTVDTADLKDKLEKAQQKATDIDALKEEVASLQRQNSHLQTKSHRSNTNASASGSSESPPSDLVQQLESKSATIEAMELEISNLRAQLSSESTSSSAHETQIAALGEKLSTSESSVEKAQRELADAKQALTRASEKALKEGVDKTSTETLIKNLERELEQAKQEKTEADKKTDTLEKKLQALGNLHKESEARHQARLRESENTDKEATALRKKLASVENENLRLKEERDTTNKRNTSGGGGADDDAIDELEDEGRSRMERRIRELEGEVFDLRRGVWQEKRHELQADEQGFDSPDYYPSATSNPAANAFDDVDLVGGSPDHARRRSMAFHQHHQPQQHSTFSTVLSSGLAAFTGSGSNRGRASSSNSNRQQGPHQQQQQHQQPQQNLPATRGSLELLSEENFDDEFDEDEFARAQAEEEGRKRVEWAREIKSKLKDWKAWRLDLVDSRAGAEGAGVGMGEIFEI